MRGYGVAESSPCPCYAVNMASIEGLSTSTLPENISPEANSDCLYPVFGIFRYQPRDHGAVEKSLRI